MKPRGVIILLGPSGSGKTYTAKKLEDARFDCEYIKSTTSRAKRSAGEDEYYFKDVPYFKREIESFIEFTSIEGDFYGIHKDEMSGTGVKIAAVDPKGARALYGWCVKNGVTPMLVSFELSNEQRIQNLASSRGEAFIEKRKTFDEGLILNIADLDLPVSMVVAENSTKTANLILDRFEIIDSARRSIPDFTALRKKSITNIKAADELSRIDALSNSRTVFHTYMAASASAAIFASGSQELGVGLLVAFAFLRDSLKTKLTDDEFFKSKNVSLPDRIKYFIISSFLDEAQLEKISNDQTLHQSFYLLKEKVVGGSLFDVIDNVERFFDASIMTTAQMESVRSSFYKEVQADLNGRKRFSPDLSESIYDRFKKTNASFVEDAAKLSLRVGRV